MVWEIGRLEFYENKIVGVFCLREEEDVWRYFLMYLSYTLDCLGIPQPLTVPAHHF